MTDKDLTPEAVERLVTRYECFDAEPNQEGGWVDYEDYAALAAALEEMTRRRDGWKAIAEVQDFTRVYLDTCAERDAHKARAEAAEAKLKEAVEIVKRLVALYESEHDPELVSRPDWIRAFLASMGDKP